MPFTIEQRSKIVKFYLETKSLVQTQREYRKHFGVKEAPSVTSIKKIVQKFEVHGTCHNRNKGNSGRRVSARTELNIDTVRESTVRSPKKSIRRRSSELGLTKSTVQRILKQDLNLYPYKLEIKQTLTDRDKEQRFSPLDFFLWGYAKDNVYKNKPTSISELKQEITTFMRAISADTCKAVIQNFAVRVRECLLRHGDHIEHVI